MTTPASPRRRHPFRSRAVEVYERPLATTTVLLVPRTRWLPALVAVALLLAALFL